MMRKMVLMMLIIFFILAGCSRSENPEQAVSNNTAVSDREISAAEGSDYAANYDTDETYQEEKASDSGAAASDTAEKPSSSGVSPSFGAEDGDRKLIYHANLVMEVSDYAAAQTEIRNVIHLSGGYVLQFFDNKSLHEEGGTFVIKVPSGGFFTFINELEKMKPLSLQRSVQGQDVTEEYVDLEARLKAKQVVESRLLAFMEKASKVDDLVRFSQELERVQGEIEQIKGRMRYLDRNVAMSTVEVRVYETIGERMAANEHGSPMIRAWNALKTSTFYIYRTLEGIFVIAAGALPILLALGILALPIGYGYRKRKAWRGTKSVRIPPVESKEQNPE